MTATRHVESVTHRGCQTPLPLKGARGPAGGKLGHAPLGKEKAPRGLCAGRVAAMCAG